MPAVAPSGFVPLSPSVAKKPNIEPSEFFIESFDPKTSFDAFEQVKPSAQSRKEKSKNKIDVYL